MSYDQFKADLAEARGKAQEVDQQAHVAAEVRKLVRDLVQFTQEFEQMVQSNQGQSSDVRLLKKRWDQAKTDVRAVENKVETLKTKVVSLIEGVKAIGGETSQIIKRNEATPTAPDAQSAARIKTTIQKMAEVIVEMTKT